MHNRIGNEMLQWQIDYFDFANLDSPFGNMFGGGGQHPIAVVSRLRQDRIQILKTRQDPDFGFTPLAALFRTRIECGAEAFADFLDDHFELIALVECYERYHFP